MKIRSTTCFAAVLSCAAAVSLTACGKPDHIDLLGVKLGMTQAEVKAAAPSGADLYCRGDGDDAFDQASGLPPSTTLRFCTWSTVDSSTGKRTRAQIQIGSDVSSMQQFAFDYSGSSLKSFGVEIPNNAYDRVVKTLTDKLGSPEASLAVPGFGGSHWDAKDDRLTASVDMTRQYMTELLLLAKPADRS